MPRFCDSCGAPLGEAKRFCTACGAPILGAEESAPAEKPTQKKRELRSCACCGAELEEDAAYCEQCGARTPTATDVPTQAAKAAADEIRRRYNPLWIIPLLLAALALFAVPASLKSTGVPEILKNPLAWAVLLTASIGISSVLYLLLKRSNKALHSADSSIGGEDRLPPGAAASAANSAGVTLAVTLLAAIVLLALSLLGLGGGSGGSNRNDVNVSPKPTASAALNAPVVTAAPTAEPIPKEQTLTGVWLPEDSLVAAEGISGPNMVTQIPSILFQDGCMFMGYGDNAADIYSDACLQNNYIPNFNGFPFTYSDGVITISTLSGSPDQVWTIDGSMNINTGMSVFVPWTDAAIVEKG